MGHRPPLPRAEHRRQHSVSELAVHRAEGRAGVCVLTLAHQAVLAARTWTAGWPCSWQRGPSADVENIWAGEYRARGPIHSLDEQPCSPHQVPVYRQGTGRHRLAVTPSATRLGVRTRQHYRRCFYLGKIPACEGSGSGVWLRPSPRGPPTVDLVHSRALCPDDSPVSDRVWTESP